jgi:LuxR family maltose regulon positive regulatory protein
MLLRTKFLAPAFNEKSVPRPRLLDRLEPRSARKVLLVSAPAGYGKTTLVLQWLHQHDQRLCWLSLDENDDKPDRFWQYFIGAIGTSIDNFGSEAMQLLSTAPNLEACVTALINELSEWALDGNSLSIVLDDFHNIQHPDTLRSFSYLVDFLPPNIELIITTRFEPALPISRWSVKNWVDAIYASDLVFTYDESKQFLADYMALSLNDKQVEEIYLKTEGWIAALQLTALSAAGKPANEQAYLRTDQLLSDDRHFSDYVISEILEHQDQELESFLLETSCLMRLNAPLCDHIRERSDSQANLQKLEQKNLFVIPLDKQGEWYRYHEMFRDSLLSKLKRLDPQRLVRLQNKAVEWLLEHEQPHEAIEQAVQLKDWNLLASLLEKNGNNLIHEGHHLPILSWIALLPDTSKNRSPRLLMLKLWALFFSNKIEVIPPLLDELENLIDDQRIADIETSADELIDLHSEISLIRSYLARTQSDLRSANALTKQVLDELDNTNMPLKSVTYYGIGLDSFTIGDLESAETALLAAIEHGKREKKYTTVLSSSGLLGWIYFYQGKLEIALETGIQSQQWIDSYQDPSQPRVISCWQNSILAMIYVERNEATIASSYINPLLKHISIGTEPGLHIIIQYTQANVLFAQGRFVDAIECLDDAIHVYDHKRESIVFKPPSLVALKSRCLLGMNKVSNAQIILDQIDSDMINELPLNFEDINLCKARVFMKQGKLELALEIADRIEQQARSKRHTYHLIQALHLQSLIHFKAKREELASSAINDALSHAAKDGLISVFLNEDQDTTNVLALCQSASLPDIYLKQLSQALGVHNAQTNEQELPGAAALESNLRLLEPLSQRELEVLKLIDQGLANKEIASKLELAPATVKAHIRNIYGKISAKSRTEALSKARQLQLI